MCVVYSDPGDTGFWSYTGSWSLESPRGPAELCKHGAVGLVLDSLMVQLQLGSLQITKMLHASSSRVVTLLSFRRRPVCVFTICSTQRIH